MRNAFTISFLLIFMLWDHNLTASANRSLFTFNDASAPLCMAPQQTIDTQPANAWAFEETFDGDPSSPSQTLLPQTFDYVVTHRTHPAEHFDAFDAFPSDHDQMCAGPNPDINPLPQHDVVTAHDSAGTHPDASFFICKDHMMSSMGDVSGYSVSSFWPKQEFDFSAGGVLEFDVNINAEHPRSWWEVVIMPRNELKVGAAHEWLPISETYPKDRIVFDYANSQRYVQIGAGAIDPEGILVEAGDDFPWVTEHPDDAANADRRIRRTMRMTFSQNQVIWAIQKADGSFDEQTTNVPGGLPFTRGLVVFKTHAYTPQKDGNMNTYTFHWDNIRFSGPVVGRYESFEADDVVYLQANGDRNIGENQTVNIDLPHVGPNPVLFGQIHNPMMGQVLLSINGGENMVVHPFEYSDADCYAPDWKSFMLPVDPALLHEGANTFKWTIGPRPGCVDDWIWNGFSVKSLEMQFDLSSTPIDLPYDLFLPMAMY